MTLLSLSSIRYLRHTDVFYKLIDKVDSQKLHAENASMLGKAEKVLFSGLTTLKGPEKAFRSPGRQSWAAKAVRSLLG